MDLNPTEADITHVDGHRATNGVRIEDDVAITHSGVECLTSLSREVIQVA